MEDTIAEYVLCHVCLMNLAHSVQYITIKFGEFFGLTFDFVAQDVRNGVPFLV